MNFPLPHMPERTTRPRAHGLTMVMDKGLSLREAEDLIAMSAADKVDFLKLGFGTSMFTPNSEGEGQAVPRLPEWTCIAEAPYSRHSLVRNNLDDYLKFIDQNGIGCLEISDGSMVIDHDYKCELIHRLKKDFKVLSEVGSKEEGILISPAKWIRMMRNELDAGSFKVIAEARESGTVGIYRPNGSAHTQLIRKILSKVDLEDILWEAPKKEQQVWFIKQFGANVNLGNIGPADIIPLECLRVGLRGDTFFHFLPEELKQDVLQQEIESE